jgi:probable blue pigment (indigoidine) exporter
VLSLLFWRFTIAATVLVAAVLVRRAAGRAPLEAVPRTRLLGLGVAFCFVVLVGFMGLARLDASVHIVLVYLYPVFVVIGAALLGRPPVRSTWLAVALVTSGVALTVPELFTGGTVRVSAVGVALSLSQAVLFAVYVLVNSRVTPAIDGLTTSAYTLVGACIAITPLALAQGVVVPTGRTLVLEVLLFALVPTVIATVCFFAALRRLDPSVVAMILPLEVVLAIAWAVLFLGEHLEIVGAIGAAVVVTGVVLAQRANRPVPPDIALP